MDMTKINSGLLRARDELMDEALALDAIDLRGRNDGLTVRTPEAAHAKSMLLHLVRRGIAARGGSDVGICRALRVLDEELDAFDRADEIPAVRAMLDEIEAVLGSTAAGDDVMPLTTTRTPGMGREEVVAMGKNGVGPTVTFGAAKGAVLEPAFSLDAADAVALVELLDGLYGMPDAVEPCGLPYLQQRVMVALNRTGEARTGTGEPIENPAQAFRGALEMLQQLVASCIETDSVLLWG